MNPSTFALIQLPYITCIRVIRFFIKKLGKTEE